MVRVCPALGCGKLEHCLHRSEGVALGTLAEVEESEDGKGASDAVDAVKVRDPVDVLG